MGQRTSAAIGGEPKEIDWRQHLEAASRGKEMIGGGRGGEGTCGVTMREEGS